MDTNRLFHRLNFLDVFFYVFIHPFHIYPSATEQVSLGGYISENMSSCSEGIYSSWIIQIHSSKCWLQLCLVKCIETILRLKYSLRQCYPRYQTLGNFSTKPLAFIIWGVFFLKGKIWITTDPDKPLVSLSSALKCKWLFICKNLTSGFSYRGIYFMNKGNPLSWWEEVQVERFTLV